MTKVYPCVGTSGPCPMNTKKKLRYIQPPVRELMRPALKYVQPTIPIDSETIQKASFIPYDAALAAQCRSPSVKPISNLNIDRDIKIDDDTVTSLSYPPILGVHRNLGVIPINRIAMGTGDMSKMTTQRHDYVAKPKRRLGLIKPNDNMTPSTQPLDSDTTQLLSYQPPAGFIPSQNCKPNVDYKQPEISMDLETCHKASYQTPHTRPREIPPWAMKPKFAKPIIPINDETLQRCSYRPPGEFIEICEAEGDNDQLASVAFYAKAGL